MYRGRLPIISSLHHRISHSVSSSVTLVTRRSFEVAMNTPPCASFGRSRLRMLYVSVGNTSLSLIDSFNHDSVPIIISGLCWTVSMWKVCFLATILWQFTFRILSERECPAFDECFILSFAFGELGDDESKGDPSNKCSSCWLSSFWLSSVHVHVSSLSVLKRLHVLSSCREELCMLERAMLCAPQWLQIQTKELFPTAE